MLAEFVIVRSRQMRLRVVPGVTPNFSERSGTVRIPS